MKKITMPVVAAVLAIVLASFSFTTHKPYATVTKLYDVSTNNVISTSDPNGLVSSELNDQSYWSAGSLGSHSNGSKLYAIQYDSSPCTFQYILNCLKDYFLSHHDLPADGQLFICILGCWITIFRKS